MNKIKVFVNGLPGNVAVIVAKHILNDDRFELIPYSMTGPEIKDTEYCIGSFPVKLISPEIRDNCITGIKEKESSFISVDYTHPSAVNANAEFYCKHNLPFVMGTTGGDRRHLGDTVRSSTISAVIAPNMAKQIVGFQAMIEWSAKTFPDLFKGYSLEVKESHQKGKADTSGTAKAMAKSFKNMGALLAEDKIIKIRDPNLQQTVWNVPEEYLKGHGYHTYSLVSEDKTVSFTFSHNVNGRDVYAKGTMDAVLFLFKKIQEGATGKVFNMIDVLKEALV